MLGVVMDIAHMVWCSKETSGKGIENCVKRVQCIKSMRALQHHRKLWWLSRNVPWQPINHPVWDTTALLSDAKSFHLPKQIKPSFRSMNYNTVSLNPGECDVMPLAQFLLMGLSRGLAMLACQDMIQSWRRPETSMYFCCLIQFNNVWLLWLSLQCHSESWWSFGIKDRIEQQADISINFCKTLHIFGWLSVYVSFSSYTWKLNVL